jgi:hypothetical protein
MNILMRLDLSHRSLERKNSMPRFLSVVNTRAKKMKASPEQHAMHRARRDHALDDALETMHCIVIGHALHVCMLNAHTSHACHMNDDTMLILVGQ